MSEPRPRPQYGEYASPEDQAKAMGLGATAGAAPADGAAPDSPRASAAATASSNGGREASVPENLHAHAPTTTVPGVASPRRRRTWDVVLTSILLGLGASSVLSSFRQYADFPATLNDGLAQLGYGSYSATALASSIGIGLNVAQIVIYGISAAVAIFLIRRRRIGFYVPLIGLTLFIIVMTVLLFVALAGDPALMDNISGS